MHNTPNKNGRLQRAAPAGMWWPECTNAVNKRRHYRQGTAGNVRNVLDSYSLNACLALSAVWLPLLPREQCLE